MIIFAGIINGAFALPTKHVSKWNFENIWLQYSIWAFLILPWLAIFILAPNVVQIYSDTPTQMIWTMVIGGFLFGAGQVAFAFALNMIGLGLGFVICIGLSTAIGFSLPLILQHPEAIATPFGMATIIGVVLALVGLIIATYAGELRDKHRHKILPDKVLLNEDGSKADVELINTPGKNHYFYGVLLAIMAGLTSTGQNLSFSLTSQMQEIALSHGASQLGAANIMWPGFLFFGFIPYAIYMLSLHKKNNSFKKYSAKNTKKYFLFAIVMGIGWFGSLLCYGKASQLIGSIGPVIGWPLFMALIILTSNFIGWKHNEWENCGQKAKYTIFTGLIFLVLSVTVLGYSAML
ncbi:MAG: hypothetical protein GY710_16810 [Desulfobacteraceae bacterium]|nr:hypothetical protein [Desulfobacteraceae bacterium]